MSLFAELKELGVNVDEGLERVMDDAPLYEMMLGMFLESVNSNSIEIKDFDSENLESLIERVHILKGLTGNLAMTPLYEGYMRALELLRTDRAEEAQKEYEKLLPAQAAMIDCIKRYVNVS